MNVGRYFNTSEQARTVLILFLVPWKLLLPVSWLLNFDVGIAFFFCIWNLLFYILSQNHYQRLR